MRLEWTLRTDLGPYNSTSNVSLILMGSFRADATVPSIQAAQDLAVEGKLAGRALL